MVLSIVVVCVLVPMAFIFSGWFVARLESAGIHATPNFAGGYAVAEFDRFESNLSSPPPGVDQGEMRKALAVRRFSVRKVAFNRWAGMGIEPRLNLGFEFEGQLPDPQNSSGRFSETTIHVYIKAPGRNARTATSDKAARVDFSGLPWDYEVIADGLHDQARIFDVDGNLVARGLGLFLDYTYAPDQAQKAGAGRAIARTSLTVALPMRVLGDPAKGAWQYYVLIGLSDSRHPSMMLHSSPDGGLGVFCRAIGAEAPPPAPAAGVRPVLPALLVSNPD